MQQYLDSDKGKYTILGICTFLGILFNALFYNRFLGVNYFIFVLAIIVSFLWLCYQCKISVHLESTLYIIITSLLACSYFIHGNPLLMLSNFLIIPIGILIVSLKSTFSKIKWDFFIIQFIGSFGKMHLYLQNILHFSRFGKSIQGRGIIIGLLISICLLIIIVPLMGSADTVFKYFMDTFIIQLQNIQLMDYIFQVFIVLGVASFLFAYVIQLESIYRKMNTFVANTQSEPLPEVKDKSIYYVANMTILILICLLYFIFSIVQFKYLFLGNGSNIPNFSYAHYARSGFFQMLLLTVINFFIIMVSRFNLRELEQKYSKIPKIMMTVLVLFNYVLIASSFYRMYLYESTYGYTMLRLCVYLTLTLGAILMIIIALGIWKSKLPIIKWVLIVSLIFYSGVNFMNLDAFIAKKNVDRYFEKGVVDIEYLSILSYDAYPQLERLMDSDNSIIKQRILEIFTNNSLKNDYSWQEYNISRNRAIKIVDRYQ
ncbi:MAG: DUF4173 domain-containing protein [Eubacteriales bacterium]